MSKQLTIRTRVQHPIPLNHTFDVTIDCMHGDADSYDHSKLTIEYDKMATLEHLAELLDIASCRNGYLTSREEWRNITVDKPHLAHALNILLDHLTEDPSGILGHFFNMEVTYVDLLGHHYNVSFVER